MTINIARRQALASLAAAAAPWLTPTVQAAGYPVRPVRLFVGAPPGGPADFLARVYGDSVGQVLGQGFVVDNKPGASGTLAADATAKAPADGHTLLIAGPAGVAVAPYLMPKLGYDAERDLVPVSMLGAGAFAMVVNPSLPVNNVQGLIAHAKARPGEISFGSGGNGSSGHLCAELFSQMAGIKMLHVPYKGDGQAVNDLLAGQIQLMFTAPNVAMPQVKAGRLRLLAVTTRDRTPSMPETPTIHDSGLRDFEYLGWIIAFAPAATPRPTIEALSAAWIKVRNTPAVRGKLEELSMVAPERLGSGEPLLAFVRGESSRLGKIIREAGIKAE